jgi:hypothetical protein
MHGSDLGYLPPWWWRGRGLRKAPRVRAGDGDGNLQFAVQLSRDTNVDDADEHVDDEGVAMSVAMTNLERDARVDAYAPASVTSRRRRQRGNVLLEQALVLPVMMLLMFGVIDMARALYAYHYVGYIAREATRWASVRSGTGSFGPIDNTDVTAFVKDVPLGLDSTQFTTDLKWISPPNLTPLCLGGLANSNLNRKPGCVVQVTVNYQFKFVVPIMPAGFQMSSESQMIITQ